MAAVAIRKVSVRRTASLAMSSRANGLISAAPAAVANRIRTRANKRRARTMIPPPETMRLLACPEGALPRDASDECRCRDPHATMVDARSTTNDRREKSMQRTRCCLVIAQAIVVLAIFPAAPTRAQTPPTPPTATDAALAAQKAAFLALPESTRKAAQDALVWLGFYNGVVDGDFGRRTRDAILAFQASAKAPADGALSALELQALLAGAQKARDAIGFRIVSDAKSGARIGAPAILLSARSGVRLEF